MNQSSLIILLSMMMGWNPKTQGPGPPHTGKTGLTPGQDLVMKDNPRGEKTPLHLEMFLTCPLFPEVYLFIFIFF